MPLEKYGINTTEDFINCFSPCTSKERIKLDKPEKKSKYKVGDFVVEDVWDRHV